MTYPYKEKLDNRDVAGLLAPTEHRLKDVLKRCTTGRSWRALIDRDTVEGCLLFVQECKQALEMRRTGIAVAFHLYEVTRLDTNERMAVWSTPIDPERRAKGCANQVWGLTRRQPGERPACHNEYKDLMTIRCLDPSEVIWLCPVAAWKRGQCPPYPFHVVDLLVHRHITGGRINEVEGLIVDAPGDDK